MYFKRRKINAELKNRFGGYLKGKKGSELNKEEDILKGSKEWMRKNLIKGNGSEIKLTEMWFWCVEWENPTENHF